MEFRDGKVARETQYFGDPFEPGPSRAHIGRADGLKAGYAKTAHTPLARAELPVDTDALARFLIGKLLVRELPEGASSAASSKPKPMSSATPPGTPIGGMTPRNRALFLERGHAYVYLAYGLSWMLNVSSEAGGSAPAS